jgi:hypothetical protein
VSLGGFECPLQSDEKGDLGSERQSQVLDQEEVRSE